MKSESKRTSGTKWEDALLRTGISCSCGPRRRRGKGVSARCSDKAINDVVRSGDDSDSSQLDTDAEAKQVTLLPSSDRVHAIARLGNIKSSYCRDTRVFQEASERHEYYSLHEDNLAALVQKEKHPWYLWQ